MPKMVLCISKCHVSVLPHILMSPAVLLLLRVVCLPQDFSSLAALWGAWVKAEAGGPPLPSPLLEECKAITAIRAQVRSLIFQQTMLLHTADELQLAGVLGCRVMQLSRLR
jgi:hypothetical protein